MKYLLQSTFPTYYSSYILPKTATMLNRQNYIKQNLFLRFKQAHANILDSLIYI